MFGLRNVVRPLKCIENMIKIIIDQNGGGVAEKKMNIKRKLCDKIDYECTNLLFVYSVRLVINNE